MNFTHALKWSFLSEIVSKTMQPLVFVVLARLLTPEDYGVVAAAAMVISFSAVFWDAGMSKAIIQYPGERARAADSAFWINNFLGLMVAGILVAFSGIISHHIFHDMRVAPVLRVMSLQVLLSASAAVHSALLQKDMRFKSLFWIRLATVGVPGLISIPLAWRGMGYWSLIFGTLGGQALQVIILWRLSPWKPKFRIDPIVTRKLIHFGGWVAATAFLLWFFSWADSLVVGMYLGPHDLGLYRTGNVFVAMIYGTLFGPIVQVLYSHFSSIQNDNERVRKLLFSVIRIITFISVPLAILLYANADFIANTVFGAKWKGISMVVGILALMQGYSWVVGVNGEAYRAVGSPSSETKIAAITVGFYLLGYWWSVRQSFEAFVWTRLGLAMAATIVHFWVAQRVVGLSVLKCVRYTAVITAVCLPAIVLSHWMRPDDLVGKISLAAATTGWTLASLWLLERKDLIPTLAGLVRRKERAVQG